jgi:hypothetical protein
MMPERDGHHVFSVDDSNSHPQERNGARPKAAPVAAVEPGQSFSLARQVQVQGN